MSDAQKQGREVAVHESAPLVQRVFTREEIEADERQHEIDVAFARSRYAKTWRRDDVLVAVWCLVLAALVASLILVPEFWLAALAFGWLALRVLGVGAFLWIAFLYARAAWKGGR